MIAVAEPTRAVATPAEDLAPVKEAPLTQVHFTARDADLRVYCDAIAYDSNSGINTLMILSAMGAQSAIKALAAILQSDVRCTIRTRRTARADEIQPRDTELSKCPNGYRIHRHRFELNTWHLLAIAKQEGLLPNASAEAVWGEVRKARYTTPILRAWIPLIIEPLSRSGYLRALQCVGCASAILQAGTAELDHVVRTGLQSGALRT
jgi:hypothetical protein